MAHFAMVDNGVVGRVVVISDDDAPNEATGAAFCNRLLGGTWLQTSYNTRDGIHYGSDGQPDGKPALRLNYAGIGYLYDATIDAFLPPPPDGTNWVWDGASNSWTPAN